jgi:hypothetical protein
VNLQDWLDQWQHKSPAVQARVNTALDFLTTHYGADRPGKILSEIKCIDFSHPVELPELPAHTRLVGSKDPRVSPYRAVYFTRSGTPTDRLGVSDRGALRTNPAVVQKALYRYEVLVPVPRGEVLQSVCAAAADTWSIDQQKTLVNGGGVQYLIPRMNRYLRYLP